MSPRSRPHSSAASRGFTPEWTHATRKTVPGTYAYAARAGRCLRVFDFAGRGRTSTALPNPHRAPPLSFGPVRGPHLSLGEVPAWQTHTERLLQGMEVQLEPVRQFGVVQFGTAHGPVEEVQLAAPQIGGTALARTRSAPACPRPAHARTSRSRRAPPTGRARTPRPSPCRPGHRCGTVCPTPDRSAPARRPSPRGCRCAGSARLRRSGTAPVRGLGSRRPPGRGRDVRAPSTSSPP